MTAVGWDTRPSAPRRFSFVRLGVKRLMFLLVAGIVAYLTIPPILTVLFASFRSDFLGEDSTWTLANYVDNFTKPASFQLLINSLLYSVGTMIGATTIGGLQAWLYTRTDTPLKPFVFMTAMLPFVIPGILTTFSYIFLMSPQIGLLNHVAESIFGVRPFAIYSIPGMVLVQTLHVSPIAFAMLTGLFQSMDVTLEEAARASGANDLQVLRTVTLKLAIPGLLSAGLLIFVQAIASFEVPNLIGVPGKIYVFVSQIYDYLQSFPTDFSGAATLSTMVMVISVVGIYLSTRANKASERYATVTGKGFKPRQMRLGAWRWVAFAFIVACFIMAVVLPILMRVWVSLLPGYEVPSVDALSRISLANYAYLLHYPRIETALVNTIIVTITAATIVMVLTSIAAYLTVKTKLRGRALLEQLIFVPIAIPGTILGVSVLFWYLMAPLPISLYGTLSILVIGFVTLYLPYGMRFMTPAIMQISKEMEEAALTSGATWGRTLVEIYSPLLLSSLVGGFFFVFILSFREISAAVFLFAQGTELISLAVYDMWGEGLFGYVSALGILMVIFFIPVVVGAQMLLGRRSVL